MHAIYLLGGIIAFLIQYINSTRTGKSPWTNYDAFKAAMTGFLSWAYVTAYSIIWLTEKVVFRLSAFQKHM